MTTAKTQGSIIAWFARNPVAANLLMILIILIGLYSVDTIRKQSFPDFELNRIQIRVPYLGAAPQEVEQGIILQLERAIEQVDGIKRVTATASEGIGSVVLELEDGYEVLTVMDEVKVQVDAISSFPENTEKPVIYEIKPEKNVLFVQLAGDMSEHALKRLTREVYDEIVALDGVSRAEIVGAKNYEISIEISEAKLREYNLTLNQISDRIKASSIDLPGGAIKNPNGDILLRTNAQAYTGEEFAEIVLITQADGSKLRIRDVATVIDGFEEREVIGRFDGKDSLGIQVKSVGEQNDLLIAQAVQDYVKEKQQSLPDGVQLATWGDSSHYLQGRMDLMTSNMLAGALLVFIILTLFLQLRLAFWVIIGLPVCFLGAIALMPYTGVTINMISLFAFILVLGIVVDDAIIIGESVYNEVEHRGSSVESIISGAQRVAMPATFGVLTTIVAFVPMLTVDGPSSVIWKSIGMVVILCLIFSLIESKWILPAHLAGMKTRQPKPNALTRARNKVSKGLSHFINQYYQPFLTKAIANRYITLSVFVGALLISAGLVGSGLVRFVFFPNLPSDYIRAELTMEDGTPDSQTNKAIMLIEQALEEVDQAYLATNGEHVVKHVNSISQSQTSGVVIVELLKGENRETDGFEIANLWRDAFDEIPGVKSVSFDAAIQGGAGTDLNFLFTGSDLNEVASAALEFKQRLAEFKGVYDIADNFSGGKDEILLALKPEAESLGITLADLARQVRFSFYGVEAQRIQRDSEEIKVMVRYPEQERVSIADLENMRVITPNGDRVPFTSVASVTIAKGYSNITRINYVRSINVTARVDKSLVEPGKLAAEIESNEVANILAKYPSVKFELFGSSKDEQDAMKSLGLGFLFAIIVIYALMAIPLKSYSQPLIIMSVVPFGIIGAIVGHLVLGLSISVLSMCGIIALTGVVVNDSLIMVDFVNRAKADGMRLIDAVIRAGTQRFRAILLTSLTTFFGLVPIVLEKSLQAQIVIPMAVSLAFGILFATVITLILVPSLYIILSDIKTLFGAKHHDEDLLESASLK
ncbi:efflux RND transporter permease subunit [Catenovulum sp. SM1970]|uniref:efflux RND transporter permease subunit n=1 Tax=Marinifaba aquimaris TaxID=2741323 RepID=UPI001571EAD9|nr:efflux RND transporter permease subunit [Marinifaba aquimaris]NTS75570.1 efflux RND transporter permease subunit [Marinifaba aquimaris]